MSGRRLGNPTAIFIEGSAVIGGAVAVLLYTAQTAHLATSHCSRLAPHSACMGHVAGVTLLGVLIAFFAGALLAVAGAVTFTPLGRSLGAGVRRRACERTPATGGELVHELERLFALPDAVPERRRRGERF
jgi:hypothetical protein